MSAGDDLDLLPPNATVLERIVSKTDGRVLDTDTDIIRRNRIATTVQAKFLPALAWERSVHHWTGTDEALDRARTASSFADHGTYGRPDTQEGEIATDTGLVVGLVESGQEIGLEWPDFVVEAIVQPGDPTPDVGAMLGSALLRKNVRDWPSVRIRVAQPIGTDWIGAAIHVGPIVRIAPADTLPPSPSLYVGATVYPLPLVRILPR